jgi:hypothetical protein
MSMYSLNTILSTIAKKNGSKRVLYNFGPVGGWSSYVISAIFWSIPFLMFVALFNPYSFEYLGIAQSIIFYIVFSSMSMILVAGLMFAFNSNLIRKISPSWDTYFEGRELSIVVSSGITPYNAFFEKYTLLLKENLSEPEMHKALLKALETMEEDNKDLFDAMNRNTNPRKPD